MPCDVLFITFTSLQHRKGMHWETERNGLVCRSPPGSTCRRERRARDHPLSAASPSPSPSPSTAASAAARAAAPRRARVRALGASRGDRRDRALRRRVCRLCPSCPGGRTGAAARIQGRSRARAGRAPGPSPDLCPSPCRGDSRAPGPSRAPCPCHVTANECAIAPTIRSSDDRGAAHSPAAGAAAGARVRDSRAGGSRRPLGARVCLRAKHKNTTLNIENTQITQNRKHVSTSLHYVQTAEARI